MVRTIWEHMFTYAGDLVNLEDLRGQLTARLALLLMGASGLAAWLTLPSAPFPLVAFCLFLAVFGLGIGVRVLSRSHATLARHLLVWGLLAELLLAMWLSFDPWVPFFGLILAFISAMLVAGSGLATAGIVVGAAAWWTYEGVRAYPLLELFAGLMLSAAVGWLVMRTLYTALQWAWNMQKRADQLLEMARDRQVELGRALKSLEWANAIQRRTQRELAVARRQAEEARRMKEQFAANISHELRTPLNLILGFSELMYLSPEVYGDMQWPPTLRRDVYQIYRSSRHLLEMIDDILDLSRFEMVGFTLNKEPTPLEPLLRGAVEIARDLFRGRPVRLEVEIARDLPVLEIDRTRIRQVLLNLLNNAQRFTEEGTVRLEARQSDGEVLISVSDTGPGIPADKLPYIFDEFYQVDHSLRRSHGGAGLGLAICKRFVQAHDGRIWVESQEGVGSTFFFTLPIPGRYLPASDLHAEHPVEPPWPDPRPRILVLDPDPAVAAMIRRHVAGYDVVQVEDTDRLAEEVLIHHPRAVIRNVPPGGRRSSDGITNAPVPLIECSLPSRAWVARDLAVAACLTKPITGQQLLAEIERLGDVREVLVVDDDRGFCQLVDRMLRTAGRTFDVRHAYDGESGLSAMRARRPDLVLLDLVMPGVDGFGVLEKMRQDPALVEIPVVLLTATSYAEDALAQRGGQVVIYRPDGLRPVEILRCLEAVIGVLEPRYDERSVPEEAMG
ncbi:MAG: response regulator [Chloroflexi bacterium]|nr:response regulator [Chloroflexota bacterium]